MVCQVFSTIALKLLADFASVGSMELELNVLLSGLLFNIVLLTGCSRLFVSRYLEGVSISRFRARKLGITVIPIVQEAL